MKPVDLIALILTSTLAVILISIVLTSLITGEKMSEPGLDIMGKLIMALVALISLYLGSKLNK